MRKRLTPKSLLFVFAGILGGLIVVGLSNVATTASIIPQTRSFEKTFIEIESDTGTYYLDPEAYLPTGQIQIGEGRLYLVWGERLDVEVPRNRVTWAIALAHSTQLYRNVVGIDFPINGIFATAIKESKLGCDAAIELSSDWEWPSILSRQVDKTAAFRLKEGTAPMPN